MHRNRKNPEFRVLTEAECRELPQIVSRKANGRPYSATLYAVYGEGEAEECNLAAVIEWRASPIPAEGSLGNPAPYFVAFTYPHCGHPWCIEPLEFCLN